MLGVPSYLKAAVVSESIHNPTSLAATRLTGPAVALPGLI